MSDVRRPQTRGPIWLWRLLADRRILPLTALLLRAWTVQSPAAFALRELTGRRGAFAYRVRGGSATIVVRHGTGDPVTLGEIFHERDYEPPAAMPRIQPRRILDLGANVGYFGAFALERWPGASVVAYEPDPLNAAVHAHEIALNDFTDRWELRRAAAAASSGELRFHASGDALSHAGEMGELAVCAEDVLPMLADADLVKLDIEGGEWTILADPRFAQSPPSVIVLEYHPHPAAGPDPGLTAIGYLSRAGLTEIATVYRSADGYGMLWAWQR